MARRKPQQVIVMGIHQFFWFPAVSKFYYIFNVKCKQQEYANSRLLLQWSVYNAVIGLKNILNQFSRLKSQSYSTFIDTIQCILDWSITQSRVTIAMRNFVIRHRNTGYTTTICTVDEDRRYWYAVETRVKKFQTRGVIQNLDFDYMGEIVKTR